MMAEGSISREVKGSFSFSGPSVSRILCIIPKPSGRNPARGQQKLPSVGTSPWIGTVVSSLEHYMKAMEAMAPAENTS
jgi:hypothetical protein